MCALQTDVTSQTALSCKSSTCFEDNDQTTIDWFKNLSSQTLCCCRKDKITSKHSHTISYTTTSPFCTIHPHTHYQTTSLKNLPIMSTQRIPQQRHNLLRRLIKIPFQIHQRRWFLNSKTLHHTLPHFKTQIHFPR